MPTQTGFSSSVTGEVITRKTRSTSPEFEIACSAAPLLTDLAYRKNILWL